jgi:hypothetical protein
MNTFPMLFDSFLGRALRILFERMPCLVSLRARQTLLTRCLSNVYGAFRTNAEVWRGETKRGCRGVVFRGGHVGVELCGGHRFD